MTGIGINFLVDCIYLILLHITLYHMITSHHNPSYRITIHRSSVQRPNSTSTEEVARFQRLLPNPSWLMSGRTSSHQKLVSTFPWIDNSTGFSCNRNVNMTKREISKWKCHLYYWEAAVQTLDKSWKRMDVKIMMMYQRLSSYLLILIQNKLHFCLFDLLQHTLKPLT